MSNFKTHDVFSSKLLNRFINGSERDYEFDIRNGLAATAGFTMLILKHENFQIMPSERIVWLKKWGPKFEPWRNEFTRHDRKGIGDLSIEEYFRIKIKRKVAALDGFADAVNEFKGIPALDDSNSDKMIGDCWKQVVTNINVADEGYQRMLNFLTALKNVAL